MFSRALFQLQIWVVQAGSQVLWPGLDMNSQGARKRHRSVEEGRKDLGITGKVLGISTPVCWESLVYVDDHGII